MKAETIHPIYAVRESGMRQPPGLWTVITEVMRRQPVWVSILLPVVMTLVMGWADDVTGWEVSLFILYAAPIILAVWWDGALAGLFVSLVSGAVWWYANIDTHPYASIWGYAWAMVNRLFYFGVVVFAVVVVRKKQDGDAAYILMLEERRQLEQDIVSVSEHEQQRIGRDLHDGLCQHLAAVGCAARLLSEDLQGRGMQEAQDATLIEESIQQAVLEARNLARGIFPVHVDRDGLSAALNDLANMTSRLTGAQISIKEETEVFVDDPDVAMHLYRIAQEAVANAVRHGKARKLAINLGQNEQFLELSIEDDGQGISSPQTNSEGMGLRTMHYRSQILGAYLQITPRREGGTKVLCRLPLTPQTKP